MHKNELIIPAAIFLSILVLIGHCFINVGKLEKLRKREERVRIVSGELEKLQKEISSSDLNCSKSMSKIFSKDAKLNNLVRDIAEQSHVKNVFLKHSKDSSNLSAHENIEIKFSASKEGNLYLFIKNIFLKLSGFVIFDSIQMMKKAKNQFVAKISCRIFSFHEKDIGSIYIKKTKSRKIPKFIHIFADDNREKFTLFCVMEGARAYINDSWINVGDEIGDYKIIDIAQDSINVKRGKKIFRIPVGSSW